MEQLVMYMYSKVHVLSANHNFDQKLILSSYPLLNAQCH